MRSVGVVMLLGMLMGAALGAQAKETFKTQVSMGMGSFEATFTVSESGYAWASTDGHWHSSGVVPWKDVRKWSCSGEVSGFALDVHRQTGVNTFRFRHDDLVTIVENYLKKYAGDKMELATLILRGGYCATRAWIFKCPRKYASSSGPYSVTTQ
jgi:hypothetical protein